jgi:phosphopantothenoylcysteine synthetase/decarboxylase
MSNDAPGAARTRPTILVTGGPSYEPIDEVRRITNTSTGELGVLLANAFAAAGHPVVLLLGEGATIRSPFHPGVRQISFGTNDHLLQRLREIAAAQTPVAAVFHAAALCDFRVRTISGAGEGSEAKISSRAGDLTLTLEPAVKILSQLPVLFPSARIVGWKYELAGTRGDALAAGRRQLTGNRTALCILNGRAYGPGFGILSPEGLLAEIPAKAKLCTWLTEWLASA